jgi:hypothetical protein
MKKIAKASRCMGLSRRFYEGVEDPPAKPKRTKKKNRVDHGAFESTANALGIGDGMLHT